MSSMEKRYEIVPQMREYDRMGVEWMPYLMFFHPPGYVSPVVNTDERGFRVSYKGEEKITTPLQSADSSANLIVGGSVAFGIGATNDRKTLPSILNTETEDVWLNFGGRAFSSTQEYLLFLFYHCQLSKIKRIVIVSGMNSLSIIYLSQNYTKEIGSFFNWNLFERAMQEACEPQLSLKRKILGTILRPVLGNRIDYASIPKGQLLASVFGGRQMDERACENAKQLNRISENYGEKKDDLLQVMNRDILHWKLIADKLGIELYYFLQPLANWVQRKNSPEENTLFSILDSLESNVWNVLRDYMGLDQYEWFRGKLGEICASHSVPFFDLNEALSDRVFDEKWLFVDRVHLTDEGNQVVANMIKEKVAQ